jgi:AcrR family transcriptional regulator
MVAQRRSGLGNDRFVHFGQWVIDGLTDSAYSVIVPIDVPMSLEEIRAEFDVWTRDVDPNDPRERKRARILAAGTRLFVAQGYRKTSVDEIAREAGVSKGTVYLYFKNKNDLLVHAIAAEKMVHRERIEAIFEPGLSARKRLMRYLNTIFEILPQMPLARRLLRGDPDLLIVMAEMAPDLREKSEENRLRFFSMMLRPFAEARGWTEEDVLDRAMTLEGLVMSSASMLDSPVSRRLNPIRRARLLAETLANGLISGPDEQ